MDQNPKQQVAEKLRSSANVLVTVSKNPSVDQLAAAIGLSLMLDALGKHTATVFSGQIPDILKFLEPEKTFDNNVDGLRDFIISLDKEKADKLRYKVEDDVVKIYITPYRSKITDKDLTFTQGDFNVDVVIALGVKKKADLDEAITAHGRILHDATVVAVNAGEIGGDVGSIDWTDPNANSLCEMLVSISEALEGGVLDAAMSTAFLTGIVSVTERFSNERTTPKLMTMAAQLMAAGANQQLISKELQLSAPSLVKEKSENNDDEATFDLHNDKKSKKSGTKHEKNHKKEEKIKAIKENADDIKLDELEKQLQEAEEEELIEEINDLPDVPKEMPEDKQKDDFEMPAFELPEVEKPKDSLFSDMKTDVITNDVPSSPSLGGTFNATSEEANQAKQNELKDGFNDEILSHNINPLSSQPAVMESPQVPTPAPAPMQMPEPVSMPAPNPMPAPDFGLEPAQPPMPDPNFSAEPPQPPASTEAADMAASLEEARRAVNQAAVQSAYDPAGDPLQSLNAQPMIADTSQQLQHDPMQMPQPQMQQPPMAPPPMPPQMPPGMAMPPQQQMPAQQNLDPNMNMGAQTFSIPAPQMQQPYPPQQQMSSQPMQQPYPPLPGAPPPPVDNGQFPPPPQ